MSAGVSVGEGCLCIVTPVRVLWVITFTPIEKCHYTQTSGRSPRLLFSSATPITIKIRTTNRSEMLKEITMMVGTPDSDSELPSSDRSIISIIILLSDSLRHAIDSESNSYLVYDLYSPAQMGVESNYCQLGTQILVQRGKQYHTE